MKKTICIAAVITIAFVIAIFAGPGDDTGSSLRSPRLEMSLAAVPEMINYQGVLKDDSGIPLSTTVSMTLTIYDAPSGGTTLWSETHGFVASFGGLFNVLLGSVTPIPPEVFEEPDRWLGISVGADPEMTPRQRIASSAYAYQSRYADDADLLDGQDATEFAAASHEHDASEIISGTVEDGRIPSEIARDSEVDAAIAAHQAATSADHDDRYYTEAELNTDDGAANESGDPVSWYKIKDIPAGFADGTDDVGSGGGGISQISAGTGIDVTNPTGPTATVTADIGTGSGQVAAGDHDHDADYVNEGQTNSITSGMIQDGAVLAEILDDDGDGSGLDADLLDGQHASDFLSTTNDWGRSGVATELYEGTTILSDKYLGISAKAADADALDGHDSTYFATAAHDHDADYVNEGQANSVTSGMIVDGAVADADISASADIDPGKILGTAWTGDNDGSGSGLDADKLDNHDSSYFATATHNHDDRYYTETELNTSDGNGPNSGSNRMHWDNLVGVPAGFADGTDDVGSGGGGISQINAGTGIQVTNPTGPTATVAADIGTGSGQVAAGDHDHDADYVNEGQTNSVTSGMIQDGEVSSGDLKDGAALTEILDDDGSGSGLDADLLDGQHASDFVTSVSDWGRQGVATNLYEGTTALSDKYLGISAKAADADALDGHDSDYFAIAAHDHDPNYVNEGQPNSISSGMIIDAAIVDADLSATAAIDPSKISGTAWTSNNDGTGSGLDADLLDGHDWSEVLSTGSDYGRSGVAADLYEGTTALSAKYLGISAKAADADALDSHDSSYFATVTHDHDADYVNEGQANSITSAMIVDGTVQEADLSFAAGDITAVNAGTGLSGGGASGDVTLDVSVPLNLSGSVANPNAVVKATNSGNGIGVHGESNGSWGVYGKHTSSGNSGHIGSSGYGVYGNSSSGYGVAGISSSGYGIRGNSNTNYGVCGNSNSSYGVYGESNNNVPVYGKTISNGNYGYLGGGSGAHGKHNNSGNYGYLGTNSHGVYGFSSSGSGVKGQSSSGYAGEFQGKVQITGQLESTVSTGTAPFDVTSTTLVTNLNADLLDGHDWSEVLSTSADYGRSGVTTDLYEGTSTLSDKYVNEGQANSINSGMIVDGTVQEVDLSFSPGDITTVNAGTGLSGGGTSGDVTLDVSVPLDLSGSVASPNAVVKAVNTGNGYGLRGISNSGTGVCGIAGGSGAGVYGQSGSGGYAGHFVGNVKITGQLESTVSTGTAPIDVTSTTLVTSLNADLLDGQHASDFANAIHTHDTDYVNEIGPETMTGNSNIRILGITNNGNGRALQTTHSTSGAWSYLSGSNVGVAGFSDSGKGVYGSSSSGYAGFFAGDVDVTGTLSKGAGSFKIDHPIDPENKYLYHSFVESPDMMNIYNGNVVLNDEGEAWVKLPEWFEALNMDFRYQLTCIGGFAPVYVAEKISDNTFKIAGGEPEMEVSWQVTGIRQDPFANAHRIPVEEEKTTEERGYYLHPDLYGQPEEKSVEWARDQEMMQRMKEEAEQSPEK